MFCLGHCLFWVRHPKKHGVLIIKREEMDAPEEYKRTPILLSNSLSFKSDLNSLYWSPLSPNLY